jgi:hypothetical protein
VREAKRLKGGKLTPFQLTDLGDREHQKRIMPPQFLPKCELVMGWGIFDEFPLDPAGAILLSPFRAFPESSCVPQVKVFAIDEIAVGNAYVLREEAPSIDPFDAVKPFSSLEVGTSTFASSC